MVCQIARAMEYLEGKGLVHKDLASRYYSYISILTEYNLNFLNQKKNNLETVYSVRSFTSK